MTLTLRKLQVEVDSPELDWEDPSKSNILMADLHRSGTFERRRSGCGALDLRAPDSSEVTRCNRWLKVTGEVEYNKELG